MKLICSFILVQIAFFFVFLHCTHNHSFSNNAQLNILIHLMRVYPSLTTKSVAKKGLSQGPAEFLIYLNLQK